MTISFPFQRVAYPEREGESYDFICSWCNATWPHHQDTCPYADERIIWAEPKGVER